MEWELATLGEGEHLLALWITPDAGLYFYSHEPGTLGLPTTVTVLSSSATVVETRYPPGVEKADSFDPQTRIMAYTGRTPVFLRLRHVRFPLEVKTSLQMLLCSDRNCWPVNAPLVYRTSAPVGPLPAAETRDWFAIYAGSLAVLHAAAGEAGGNDTAAPLAPKNASGNEAVTPDGQGQPSQDASKPGVFQAFAPRYFQPGLEVHGLGKAMLLALLAGVLLNCMPCVLPVVSLKCTALLTVAAGEDRCALERDFRRHSLYFSLGILCFFVLLGLGLGGLGLAWGQLFQQPEVVLCLAALVFWLGLSLFGVFDLPMIDLKGGPSATDKPRLQAFSTGMLTTLLATPCSGPLLGGVLGWTLGRSPAIILPVFLALGLGMSLPYLVFARWPGLTRVLPRPGAWCVHLERAVGFLLMATTIYLLNILHDSFFLEAMVTLWVMALGAWMWGQWTSLSQSALRRWGIRGVAMVLMVAVLVWAMQPRVKTTIWKPFQAETFAALLGEKPLLVDFTADWCPNCKALEHTTLHEDNLLKWKKEYGIETLQADLTVDNPSGMGLLRALGSQSIPVVALFPRGENASMPLVLRDVFTAGQLEDALAEAFGTARPVKEFP